MPVKFLFSTAFIFLLCVFGNAQMTRHTTAFAGYEYQKQSFGEVGFRFLFLKNDDFIYRLGAGALLGAADGNLAVLPKLQGDILINTEKNVDIHHSYYFLVGTELTTEFIAPKVGISLFGLLDFTAGYGFPFAEKDWHGKKLNGVNFNFSLNIPLSVFKK